MANIRTISGISDDTWEQAQNEYDNVSGKIKELLKKDLRIEDEKQENYIDLLKNSDLTNKQLKVAKDLIRKGSLEKTEAQLGTVLNKYFETNEHKFECKKALRESGSVPFEKKGRGLKAVEVVCPECEAKVSLNLLRKTGFECAGCGKRLYDID